MLRGALRARGVLRAGALDGVTAGAAMSAVELLGRFGLGTPLIPELLAQKLFATVPMGMFRFFVGLLGFWAKWVAFGAAYALHLAVAAALGVAAVRAFPPGTGPWRRAVTVSALAYLASQTLLLPAVGAGLFGMALAGGPATGFGGAVGAAGFASLPGRGSAWLPAASMAVLHGIFGGVLGWMLARRPQSAARGPGTAPGTGGEEVPKGPETSQRPPVLRMSPPGVSPGGRRLPRRLVMGRALSAGLGFAAVPAVAALASRLRSSVPGLAAAASTAASTEASPLSSALAERFARIRGLSPEFTPNRDFYTVSKNLFDPVVNEAQWALEVTGLVERPLRFDYEELRRLALREQPHTLICISNPVGGPLISNARWRGVPLRQLLEQAGLRPGAVDVVVNGADGYADSIPLAKALEEGCLLAVEMNGEPLPPAHGYPARLLVPDIYGMKNVKWVTRIEVVDHDFKGFWQRRGWSDDARIRTMSRIDVPAAGTLRLGDPVTIAGVAFAGSRGIQRVEVSTDGGRSWTDAELKPAAGPNCWTLWALEWRPPGPGTFEILARATDGRGILQDAAEMPPLPEGATGLHRVRVRVRA